MRTQNGFIITMVLFISRKLYYNYMENLRTTIPGYKYEGGLGALAIIDLKKLYYEQ